MIAVLISSQEALSILKQYEADKHYKGKFFKLKYYGKDGVLRERLCKFGVTCKLKGGKAAYDFDAKGCISVYDETVSGYRSVKWASIVSMSIDGKKYEIQNL